MEAVGVEISAFPLSWHIAYTTACCYRTSRDNCNIGLIIQYEKVFWIGYDSSRTIFRSSSISAFITWTEIKIWSVVRRRFRIEHRSTLGTMQVTAKLGSNSNLTCLKLDDVRATRSWYVKSTCDDCYNVQIAGCIRMDHGTLEQRLKVSACGGIKYLESKIARSMTLSLKASVNLLLLQMPLLGTWQCKVVFVVIRRAVTHIFRQLITGNVLTKKGFGVGIATPRSLHCVRLRSCVVSEPFVVY